MSLYFACPHCGGEIEILPADLNCRIFRHGVLKSDGANQQGVSPHETKENCDRLVANNLVQGCCKPFRVVNVNGVETIEICDYI